MVSNCVSLAHLAEAAAALSKLGDVGRANCSSADQQKLQSNHSQPNEEEPAPVSDDDDLQLTQQHGFNQDNISYNNQSKEIFPQRLLAILSEPSLADIISWLPNGRSFVILRPDVLAEDVLPKYLPPAEYGRGGSVKYPSFTRKLNRWGFRQITRGASTGAFHHALFRRDEPELCLEMVCAKSRKRSCGVKSMEDLVTPTETAQSLLKNVSMSSPSSSSSLSAVGTLPPKKRRLLCSEDGAEAATQTNATFTEPAVSYLSVHTTSVPINMDESTSTGETMVQNNVVHTIIRNNADFVASVLRERDEMERLKVAKASLLKAFLEASGKL